MAEVALVRKIGPAVLIFAAVGVLVAAWAAAGVLALLMQVGLNLAGPGFFLPGAALACALLAFATGTSWGTVATVGIALMGVARGLGVDPALAAGAVVAGAHAGDRLSPLSETATLAAAVAGTSLYTHLCHSLLTVGPALAISLGLYAALGPAPAGTAGADFARDLMAALAAHYDLHPVLWLPVAVVVVAALLRGPVVLSLLASAALAMALAVWRQGFAPGDLVRLTLFGYSARTGHPVADQLLSQGGIWSMGQLALVAVALFALVTLGLRSRVGRGLLMAAAAHLTTRARALAAATALALALVLMSGSSYLAILVTGELFVPIFHRRGLPPANLSRLVEDAGTVMAPLVPWGVSGLFMSRSLGVSTWEYGPWAAVCYLGWLVGLVWAGTGRGLGLGRGR